MAPDGVISTIAGRGAAGRARGGFAGDRGPATRAPLSEPSAVEPDAGGGALIADTRNQRIRRVAPDATITTVAGTGRRFAGDGEPATDARLGDPESVAVLADDGFLIADSGNNRIRRVARDGTIVTIVGSGAARGRIRALAAKGRPPEVGDGVGANAAAVWFPGDVAVAPDGGLLVADTNHYRVRYAAPASTARLAVAILGERLRVRRAHAVRVPCVAARAATARLEVRRGAHRVARLVTSVGPGRAVLVLRHDRLVPGAYAVELRLTNTNGAIATDHAELTVTRR